MKNTSDWVSHFCIVICVILPVNSLISQGINIKSGGRMVVSGAAKIRIDNGSFINNGTYTNGTEEVIMTGNTAKSISGNGTSNMYNLYISNTGGITHKMSQLNLHNLTIYNGCILTIDTTSAIHVSNVVRNKATASNLLLKANPAAANATLIFNNSQDSAVLATVEMYSKASWNKSAAADNRYKWQFIGVPVQSMTINNNFSGSFIRKHNEPGTAALGNYWIQLQNGSTLTSFSGYEIVQAAAKVLTFEGSLDNQSKTNMALSYTSSAKYPGQHIIGNSYTAAIDIKQLSFGANTEASVYLYNTGTYNEWYTNSPNSTTNTTTPGQYVVSTPGTAGSGGIPAQIPSMAAYLVVPKVGVTTDGSITIPYSAVTVKNTDLQRARSNSKIFTIIDIKGARFSDKMWIFSDANCTRNFDNGWDGRKFLGSPLAPQLWAIEADGDYQIDAVDNINNTQLGFMTGEDTNYSMTFTHENLGLQYSELYLIDSVANTIKNITQSGTSYEFSAPQSTAIVKRFKIVTSPGITTNTMDAEQKKLTIYSVSKKIFIQNLSDTDAEIRIFDNAGKCLIFKTIAANSTSNIQTNLASGSYIAKAITAHKKLSKLLLIN